MPNCSKISSTMGWMISPVAKLEAEVKTERTVWKVCSKESIICKNNKNARTAPEDACDSLAKIFALDCNSLSRTADAALVVVCQIRAHVVLPATPTERAFCE